LTTVALTAVGHHDLVISSRDSEQEAQLDVVTLGDVSLKLLHQDESFKCIDESETTTPKGAVSHCARAVVAFLTAGVPGGLPQPVSAVLPWNLKSM